MDNFRRSVNGGNLQTYQLCGHDQHPLVRKTIHLVVEYTLNGEDVSLRCSEHMMQADRVGRLTAYAD